MTALNPSGHLAGHLSAHLSEEALDDLLIDAGSAQDAAHLASCEACAARLETFRSSMAHFNQASAAWSQAKSNSICRELKPRRSSFNVLPAWSVAAAFCFAVALSFLVGMHRAMTPQREAAQAGTGQGFDRQQEIASDNAMLHAIDSAISQPVPSPVEVYGIEKTDASLARRGALREVRD